jgi:hypothetical protein
MFPKSQNMVVSGIRGIDLGGGRVRPVSRQCIRCYPPDWAEVSRWLGFRPNAPLPRRAITGSSKICSDYLSSGGGAYHSLLGIPLTHQTTIRCGATLRHRSVSLRPANRRVDHPEPPETRPRTTTTGCGLVSQRDTQFTVYLRHNSQGHLNLTKPDRSPRLGRQYLKEADAFFIAQAPSPQRPERQLVHQNCLDCLFRRAETSGPR